MEDVESVSFGGTTATFVEVSATEITVTIPAGADDATFTVVTLGGEATSGMLDIVFDPTIASLSATDLNPGSTLTITGTNLVNLTAVMVGGASVDVSGLTPSTDGTTLEITIPAAVTLGPGKVIVTTNAGTAEFDITISPVASIINTLVDYEIKGFSGSISIKVPTTATAFVYNLQGAQIKVGNIRKSNLISISNPGIYVVKLIAKDGIAVERVLVK